MKKVFIVRDFAKKADDIKEMKPLIIAHHKIDSKKGDIVTLQNIEFMPNGGFDAYYDKKKERLVLEIDLKPTDFLAIGDAPGTVEKKTLKVRNTR